MGQDKLSGTCIPGQSGSQGGSGGSSTFYDPDSGRFEGESGVGQRPVARGEAAGMTTEEAASQEIFFAYQAFTYASEQSDPDYESELFILKLDPENGVAYLMGAAMVLYGIREHTRDIDLGCNERMADALERDGFLCGYTDSGGRRFKYGEHIEVFENWLKDSVTAVEGFPVVTVRGLLEMKRKLGREKDIRDIRLIDEYLKRTDANE